MSKTLSSNVSAGLGGGSTPCFLFEVESANSIFRYATFACNTTTVPTWTGPDFEGKIAKKGLGKIRRQIDIREGGNIAQVGTWTVKILNQGLISDTLASESFYNRRAELRLIFLDKTAPSWMNAVQIAPVAYVEDVEWDEDAITFRCSDGWRKRHRNLSKNKLTSDIYPGLPTANVNKDVPILYGDWMLGNGENKTAIASNMDSTNRIIHRDYFKGYFLKSYSKTSEAPNNTRVVFAGHDLHTFPPLNDALAGKIFSHEIKKFCIGGVNFDTADSFGSAFAGLFTIPAFGDVSETFLIVPELISSSGSIANPSYAVDSDDSNLTVFTSDGTLAQAKYKIQSNVGRLSNANVIGIEYYVSKSGITNDVLQFRISRGTSVIVDWTNVTVFDGLASKELTWSDDYKNEPLSDLIVEFKAVSVVTPDNGTFSLKGIYFYVYAPREDETEIFESGKGRKFGSWIDSPDHSNAFNSGDLIENPAYLIESLLTDELSLKVKERGAAIQFQDNAVSVPYFQVPHSASLALTGIVSIECWVKLISIVSAGENFIVSKISGTTVAPYGLSISTAGKVRFWRGNGSTSNYLESTMTLSTGVWYHIVAVAHGGSGATRYIYINGVQDAGASIVQAVADGASVLRIGLLAGSTTRTNMILDELRIWDRVTTLGEAAQLYNGGAGYPKPYFAGNTKAWWRFDEEGRLLTDGSTPSAAFNATDSSGNGNTAASNNHANMRWVTGASAKVLYTESEIEENNSAAGAQSSFDVVAGKRSSWKFARQYLDRQNSLDMIKDVCKDAHVGYFPNYLGEETIARIDAGESTPSPSTYGTSQTRVKGESSTFKVKRGDLKYYYNEFYLHYKPNMATGEPEGLLFVSTPDAASYASTYTNLTSDGSTFWGLCQSAYQATLQVNRWEYTAKNIRDAATAELLLKEIIRYLTRRPYICSFNSGLSMLSLELLDLVKLTHALLPSSIDNSSRFRLTMQEIDLNECEMTNEFTEVGTP